MSAMVPLKKILTTPLAVCFRRRCERMNDTSSSMSSSLESHATSPPNNLRDGVLCQSVSCRTSCQSIVYLPIPYLRCDGNSPISHARAPPGTRISP
jgi:hypothetical protein